MAVDNSLISPTGQRTLGVKSPEFHPVLALPLRTQPSFWPDSVTFLSSNFSRLKNGSQLKALANGSSMVGRTVLALFVMLPSLGSE